jgi:hypothetical protein
MKLPVFSVTKIPGNWTKTCIKPITNIYCGKFDGNRQRLIL